MNYLSNLHLTNSTGILIAVQYSFTIKKDLMQEMFFSDSKILQTWVSPGFSKKKPYVLSRPEGQQPQGSLPGSVTSEQVPSWIKPSYVLLWMEDNKNKTEKKGGNDRFSLIWQRSCFSLFFPSHIFMVL